MNDPPANSNRSSSEQSPKSDRARLIEDLAFLIVQFHRCRRQSRSRGNPPPQSTAVAPLAKSNS